MRSFAIIPAAGFSRRMGRPKLLMPWREQPTLLAAVLRVWNTSRTDAVVLVARPGDEAVIACGTNLGVSVVVPDSPPPEMKDSVAAGLRHVRQFHQPHDDDVWLLAPADMPLISPTVIDRLLQTHDPAAPAIVQPTCDGRRGHPVLFPWALAAEVEKLTADEGLNVLSRRYPVREIPWHERGVLQDVDTPTEYRELQQGTEQGMDQGSQTSEGLGERP